MTAGPACLAVSSLAIGPSGRQPGGAASSPRFAFGAFRIGVLLLAQREPDRGAGESEGGAQAVDEVTPVGVGDGVGAAAEEDEARRPALGLGQVVETEAAAGDRGR